MWTYEDKVAIFISWKSLKKIDLCLYGEYAKQQKSTSNVYNSVNNYTN
jgi:hypothetical protein